MNLDFFNFTGHQYNTEKVSFKFVFEKYHFDEHLPVLNLYQK